jgi:hypothetical protein
MNSSADSNRDCLRAEFHTSMTDELPSPAQWHTERELTRER